MNWLLIKNSLLVGAGTTLLAGALGVAAALFIACLPKSSRSFFLGLAILDLALPPFLVTNCWLDLLGPVGSCRSWLPFNILSLPGAVWILALLLWPITLLSVLAAWQRLEPAQLESDPAVTGWALLRLLLLPLARTALAQAAILTLVLALSNFAVPAILQVKVLPAEMWIRFTTAFDVPGVLRMSWPLVLGPLLLLFWWSRREIPWPHLQSPASAAALRQQLGTAWFYCCGLVTAALCAVSAALPLWQLASARRTWTELPGAVAAGQGAVWNSFWFAVAAPTIVVALAVMTIAGRRPRSALRLGAARLTPFNFCTTILWLPLLLPGVLLGIALIALFNRPATALFYQSVGIVILAFVIRYVALGLTALARAGQQVDRDLIDVARLEGATRWQMLRYVQWPQIKPAAVAAWYIMFLLCLWDVESMILVYPPGGETLALRIFNLLHYGHNAQVNALCLALLGVAVGPLFLWHFASSVLRALATRNTRHATRTFQQGLVILLLGSVIPCLSACSPAPSGLNSRIFDHVEIVGTRGVGVGQLNKPRSLALDREDNVYVVDMTGRVQKFSPRGEFELFWQMPQTDLGKPKGMGRDRAGNIIVVEPHYQRINYFSTDGKLLAQWGEKGTNAGQLIMPRAVAVNSHGEIFVSEYGQVERVQKFTLEPLISTGLQPGGSTPTGDTNRFSALPRGSQTAKAISTSGGADNTRLKPGANESAAGTAGNGSGTNVAVHPRLLTLIGHAGTGPGEFNRPEGLCVDKQDRLYIADSCNHRIQIFSSDGKFLRMYGRAGKGPGELSYPYDICVDPAGRQYVCEFGNSRIQVFDANDHPLETIGGPGVEPGRFSNPWSIALDSAGDLYVADSQNHRVQKLISRNQQITSVADSALATVDDRFATTGSSILRTDY